jgi:glycosyltransferase involved in cell wall biosynthesis
MGYLFTNKNLTLSDRFYKCIFLALLFLLKRKKNIYFILQNKFDLKIFNKKIGYKKTVYIPSSGVDFAEFKFKKNKKKIVVMPSRVLYDKGVEEFVYAAKKLKKKYKDWHFQIIGADDYNNPSSVPKSKLNDWIKKGYIVWKEYKNNPKFIYQNASIVCMPSHREGFSKVILEAGASSLPVVASNIPGCKEGIVEYETGLLFKVKNHHDLTKKLEILIKNSNLRNTMGKNGIKFIKQNYDINIVNKKIISVYQKILNEKKKINTNSIK